MSMCYHSIFNTLFLTWSSGPSRECYRGAWRALCYPCEGHEKLLPNQPRILLHAAGGEGWQCQVLVPLTYVVHGHYLWPGRLYAAPQTGDGHPAVTWHALPWRWIWWLWLPSTWIRTWLSGWLSPGVWLLTGGCFPMMHTGLQLVLGATFLWPKTFLCLSHLPPGSWHRRVFCST